VVRYDDRAVSDSPGTCVVGLVVFHGVEELDLAAPYGVFSALRRLQIEVRNVDLPETQVLTVTRTPGIVHGGFLAVFFDSVVQHHNCDLGLAGKTTSLALTYRRPTPLLAELQFEVDRSADERRITSVARLMSGGVVLCEAQVSAVAGNLAALPAVSPRRAEG
jgi:acyl-coenzyme A thioesterase PaaI-like protein